MPAYKAPKSLVDSSIDALCQIVYRIIDQVIEISKRADTAVNQVAAEMGEAFMKGKGEPVVEAESTQKKIELMSSKESIKRYADLTKPFLEYTEDLPFEFRNIVFAKVLNDLYGVLEEQNKSDFKEKVEVESDKWFAIRMNISNRIRVIFRVLAKCLFSHKTFVFNINALTDGYFSLMKHYIFTKNFYQSSEVMSMVEEMNRNVFSDTIITFKKEFATLTSISMRHLASGVLLWNICCNCPNLWYLDLSGEMFDLQRYCIYEDAAGEFVDPILDGERLYKTAEFVESLCGLYGGEHKDFEGTAVGCFNLRSLLLPNYCWEESEEDIMVKQMMEIFDQLLYLEEVSGVCLYNILCKLNDSKPLKPLMLKLKKFDGTAGGHRLVVVDPKRLTNVKLPCVEEVVFIANVAMKPSVLPELFPNMKHLTVSPYDSKAYTFHSIIPYLRNLVSLDIEFLQSLPLARIYELARLCHLLENLSITCPGLCVKEDSDDSLEDSALKYRKVSPFHVRADKIKRKYVVEEYHEHVFNETYTIHNLKEALYVGHYSTDPDFPKFSKLSKLQFFNLRHYSEEALYQIVVAAPYLLTFTLHVTLGPTSKTNIRDQYIGALAPCLRRVRNVIIAAERPDVFADYLKLTGKTIAYLIYFCQDIRSIGGVDDWNVSEAEIEGLNYLFGKSNLLLKLYY